VGGSPAAPASHPLQMAPPVARALTLALPPLPRPTQVKPGPHPAAGGQVEHRQRGVRRAGVPPAPLHHIQHGRGGCLQRVAAAGPGGQVGVLVGRWVGGGKAAVAVRAGLRAGVAGRQGSQPMLRGRGAARPWVCGVRRVVGRSLTGWPRALGCARRSLQRD